MIKGAKKAIVRAPHRLVGNKSIEDRVIIEWTKDFSTANLALDVILDETHKFVGSWRDLLNNQKTVIGIFQGLYGEIQEENVYRATQATPQSAIDSVEEFDGVYTELAGEIEPLLTDLEKSVKRQCKQAKECIDAVQKALKKREHKKVDFDRFSNSIDKQLRKTSLTEKEEQHAAKLEAELEQAMELFHSEDEKVKSLVPHVLNSISEFLNPFTANIYLTELKIFDLFKHRLFMFAQSQGLAENSTTPYDYAQIAEDWETRYVNIQPQAEQGIKTLREGKSVSRAMSMPSKTTKQKAKNAWETSIDATGDLAHRAMFRAKHITKNPSSIKFSSPTQGMFRSEADIMTSPPLGSPVSAHSNRQISDGSMRSPSLSGQSPVFHTLIPPSMITDDSSAVFQNNNDSIYSRVRAFSSGSARALSPGGQEYIIPPKTDHDEYVVASWTFLGDQPGDVSFREGDKLRVLDHGDDNDKMWWFGETEDGRLGLFPSNYTRKEGQKEE